jgi:hypothetical protein
MIRLLSLLLFLSFFVNAGDSVCEGDVQSIDKNYTTISDMIIVLDFDGVDSKEPYSVRFNNKPGKWDLISKWVQVPESSQVRINSIALRKEKCQIPHHDEWLDCWIKSTNATYNYNGKEYQFRVNSAPEDEYLGCKSPKEFFNWVVH